MSHLWKDTVMKVVAILCSDIHLSHTAPIARSAEKDWYAAMKRSLVQLNELKEHYDVPVIIAGDIFDKWNSPAELINFACDYIPCDCFAIPGQHDLPGHSQDSIKRSAYWTLVNSNTISHLPDHLPITMNDITMTAFSWGADLYIEGMKDFDNIKHPSIAVIHKYIWHKNAKYTGAVEEDEAGNCLKRIKKEFDSFVIGDNHKSFMAGNNVLNCGGFMRRKIDEIDYRPSVGLLREDGSIRKHFLACSEDMFIDVSTTKELGEHALRLLSFVDDLKTVGNGAVDFVQMIKDVISKNKVGKRVADAIIRALEQSP